MFDRTIIIPAIILFILLLFGCISYAQLSEGDAADQPSEDVASDTISSSPPQSQDDTLWHGLWDSWEYPGDEFNTVKVPRVGAAKDVDKDKNVFVSFSHTWKGKTRQEWESILRGRASQIEQLDPRRTIILIQDEPLGSHGFTLEDVQFLYDTAKKYIPDYRFGFSFTRGTVMRRELPQNIDFALLPMYLFFREDYADVQVWSEQEFHDEFDRLIQNAREKLPDVDLFVIGQGFYNPDHVEDRRRKWRKPPLDAPKWYTQAVQRNNITGLFWWFWRGNDQNTGLSDMPEYFEGIKDIN